MKKNIVVSFFIFSILAMLINPALFAKGKQEEEKTVLNNEWLLCVTDFDSSALHESRQAVGAVFTKSLVDTFKVVSYRLRISPEYAYYEGYAWSQTRAAAAKALAAKQDERALLLYRGESNWRYKQNLKRVDAEIVKLQEDLAKAEAEMPLINQEPVFGITQGNKEGTFPPAPQAGKERRFCLDQKADAFLTGTIREYHSRYVVNLRLYTLYTQSFIYEDDIIFSPDDLNGAVDEIAGRLTAVLAGNKPAAVAVHTNSADTLVLINRSFAGRGTVEAREHPPGKISVELSAGAYKPETVETTLVPGELTEINAKLLPREYGEVTLSAAKGEQAAVYLGALYVGEAPLTLRLPLNQLEFINMETVDGQTAKIAFVTPYVTNEPYLFSVKTKTPPASGRVEKARRAYYWAWGGTWLAGIAAWIINGISRSQTEGLMAGWNEYGVYNEDFYNESIRMYRITQGAWAVVGVAAAIEIFQIARYIYISTESNTPIVGPRSP